MMSRDLWKPYGGTNTFVPGTEAHKTAAKHMACAVHLAVGLHKFMNKWPAHIGRTARTEWLTKRLKSELGNKAPTVRLRKAGALLRKMWLTRSVCLQGQCVITLAA
mmetsp:Transcript_92033/g.297754  ORF Transcript_92033/g.297754 Transcript_92033/m.297754 type:complete len:106 (-) Transcript_92033:4-321(-)